MDSYLRKKNNLAYGERDLSVVKSRSNSIEPVARVSNSETAEVEKVTNSKEDKERKECKQKLAYRKDIVELTDSLSVIHKKYDDSHNEQKAKLEDLKSQIENLKSVDQQAKAERVSVKLNSFISDYNQNEMAHSDTLKVLESVVSDLSKKITDIENLL